MYFLGTSRDNNDQMGLASSTDLLHWTEATDAPVLPARAGMFDARVLNRGLRRWLRRKGLFWFTTGRTTSSSIAPALPCSTGTIRGE